MIDINENIDIIKEYWRWYLKKNNTDKFFLIYAIILSSVSLFMILSFILIEIIDSFFFYEFREFRIHFNNNIFSWGVYYIFGGFVIIYLVELIISIIFIKNYIALENIQKIIPQIILSSFYLLAFFHFKFLDRNIEPVWREDQILSGLPILLAAISLFFSHLFVTGYFNNSKIVIFWKIMSSLTSFLLLYFRWILNPSSV